MRSRLLIVLFTTFLTFITLPQSTLASRCPAPKQTELSYRGDGTGLPAVYRKLISCPNITSLELDMTATGCVIEPDPWHFEFKEDRRIPDLTKLSLANYDLAGDDTGYIMPQWSWAYWAKLKAVNALRFTKVLPSVVTTWDETNLEKWLRAMNFSKIEELHLKQSDSTFYDRMETELPNLRRLSLHWHATGNTTAPENRIEFLRSLPPLQELSITIGAPSIYGEPEYEDMFHYEEEHRTEYPLQEILHNHCPSLTSLTLRQSECEIASKRRPMLSEQDITAIRDACPRLSSLELDIDRDDDTDWPLQTFSALTNIEGLTSMTLRLELGADMHPHDMGGDLDWNPQGITHGGPFREPRMNRTAAEALFSHLRERKKGRSLDKVVFEIGDYSDKSYMGPIAGAGWASGRARKFVCEATADEEREGDARFGYCHVVGDEDPFPWDDGPPTAGAVTEVSGQDDDAAVEAYLVNIEALV